MNLVLLFPEEFISDAVVRLRGRRAAHIDTVQRAKPGDTLRVGLLNDRVGKGRVVRSSAEEVELEVTLEERPPVGLSVTLVLALPRPKSLERVLQTATTMGVKRIILLNAYRVEKSFWSTPALRDGAIRDQLVAALEQGRDTVLPEVRLERRFKPFVEDRLPEVSRGTLSLVAHPAAGVPCPRDIREPVTLAVGPEGGWIDYELQLFRMVGFQAVTLGPRPLRVEQAVPALLGRLF